MPEPEPTLFHLAQQSEEWRPVPFPGYCDAFSVSSFGEVRREVTTAGGRAGLILKPKTDRGYFVYTLTCNGVRKYVSRHVLIALAFVGPAPGPIGTGRRQWQVDHVDGVKAHNSPSNLEWVTGAVNGLRAQQLGLLATGDRNGSRLHPEKRKRGIAHPLSKFTDAVVQRIRRLHADGLPYRVIAKHFGVTLPCVRYICLRTVWRHVGDAAEPDPSYPDLLAAVRRLNTGRLRGSAHHMTTLTEAQVREIRQLHGPAFSYTALAKRFGVGKTVVARIITRETWQHVA